MELQEFDRVAGNGEKVAVIDGERVLTYQQLNSFCIKFGNDIRERSLVIIIVSNTIESIAGYVACIRNRCIPILLRNEIDMDSLWKYAKCYHVNYIWSNEKTIRILENKMSEQDKSSGKSLSYQYKAVCKYHNYCLIQIAKRETPVHQELALLLTTSGSTGSNKLVRISYKNLSSNTVSIAKYLGIKGESRAITSLPMNYTYGLSVINTHLYKGATIVATEAAVYCREFWYLFRKHNVTSFSGVPYSYEILRKMGFYHWELPSLEYLTVAGGKMSEEEEEYFLKYAIDCQKKFIIMYGQTEATARMSYRPASLAQKKKGSIGISIPNGKMWIESQDGRLIDQSYVQGEIVYQGSNVAMGYAISKEDLMRGYDWGTRLYTGDLGYMDEDGYFYLSGRKDRMVKINGIRVDLEELERNLEEVFLIYDFHCEMEKCLEKDFFKRIIVSVRRKKSEVECNATSEEREMEQSILQYLMKRTCFKKRYFKIIFG